MRAGYTDILATNGHTLLKRCENASKKQEEVRMVIAEMISVTISRKADKSDRKRQREPKSCWKEEN